VQLRKHIKKHTVVSLSQTKFWLTINPKFDILRVLID
jgi:hypothetical protein